MNTKTDLFLEQLIKDASNDMEAPFSCADISSPGTQEKKDMIRSLMNIRVPRALSTELLQRQDAYLQEELAEKGIVRLPDIPTLNELQSCADSADRISGTGSSPMKAIPEYPTGYPAESPVKRQIRSYIAKKLSLWQGDITRLNVGAIVNAANSQMLGCFVPCHRCIDNAIHSAAGMQLREECHQIMTRKRAAYGANYEEPTGTATMTNAYNLPCDHVIHTVGPIVYGELTAEHCRSLQNCYENILNCCLENHIRSVAFCCISTGEFHFPNEKAAEIAIETVTSFLETHDAPMERIIFNVFTDRDCTIYERLLGLCA